MSRHITAYIASHRILSSRVASHHMIVMRDHTFSILYARNVYQSIPESVVSPGIALAISAIAFPSCCIRDTVGGVGINVGANVGINVGADINQEDTDHY